VVLIIGLPDLLTSVQLIYARNFQQIPLLAVACFWYLVCTTVLTVIQSRLEKKYARGVGEAGGGYLRGLLPARFMRAEAVAK
jgi:polar amino acid transport system permease protein